MIRKLRIMTVAGLSTFAAASAHAGDTAPLDQGGFYVLGRLGTALPIEQDIRNPIFGKGDYDPDDGFGLEGAVGKYLGDGWRAEVSYKWLRGSDGTASFDSGAVFQLDGHGQSQTVLFNVLKTICNFDTPFGTISPFVGAGVGFSSLDRSDIKLVGFGTIPGDDTDTVFAAAAHLGYDVNLAPGVTLSSQWSFQYADDATFKGAFLGFDLERESQVQISTFTGLRIDLN